MAPIDVISPSASCGFDSVVHENALTTVAVSLYDAAEFVVDCLNGVKSQTLECVDLVVVDDCSRDSGVAVVTEWMMANHRRFGRCRFLRHGSNQGLAAARNQGFAVSQTPFIFVLDADNALYPRCLAACEAQARESEADAVYTLIEVFGEDVGVMGTDLWSPKQLARGNYIDAMALIRKAAWQHVGGYRQMPAQGWEDYDLWLKFAEAGFKVHRLPEILCRYRRRPTSMLSTLASRPGAMAALHDDIALHHPAVRSPETAGVEPGLGHNLKRIDSRRLPDTIGEVRAFLVVRNEIQRLPFTLEHHRSLGTDRFLVVDDGSSDGTTEYLLSQPDVHVFRTNTSYLSERLGIDWVETILSAYGEGSWCLILDGDEQLVYPDCESMPLRSLCAELERLELDCLATMFIDMYSDRPILDTVFDGRSPLSLCSFFDRDGYHRFPTGSEIPRIVGGPRARLFWPQRDLSSEAAFLRSVAPLAFDETRYLAAHPDVAAAVEQGIIESALAHFLRYGRFEGRSIFLHDVAEWPESTYLTLHPDVKGAVELGEFSSGLEHFVRFGQYEYRHLMPDIPPWLSQFPLIRWSSRMQLGVGRHILKGAHWRRGDAVGGALLHFKLMSDLQARSSRVESEATAQIEPAWRVENRRYLEGFRANPNLSGFGDKSVRYVDSGQLIQLDLVNPLDKL